MSDLNTLTSADFTKTVRLGKGPDGHVFCKIEFADGRLSISGVEGPEANGNCRGSCGQILTSLSSVKTCAPGWTLGLIAKFRAVWKAWHLNDMIAGSPAQRLYLAANHVTCVYPQSLYVVECEALAAVGLNPDPSYLHNGKPYEYGSAGLRADVPADVLEFLRGLPDADITPAWV